MPTKNSCVDKDHLYGEFQRTQRWRDKLSRKLAHKSLDIPDDDMDIKVQKGLGWKELLVIGGLALGGWHLSQKKPEVSPPAPPVVEQPEHVDHNTHSILEPGVPKPKGGNQ